MCLQCAVWCPNKRLSTGPLIRLAAVQATVLFSLLWNKVSWVGRAQYFNWELALNM